MSRICAIEGCGKPHGSKGFCAAHAARMRRHGDPKKTTRLANGTRMAFVEKAAKYEGDDCLTSPFKPRNHLGYGYANIGDKTYGAHYLVCEIAHGPRPTPSHQTAHACGHPSCVNPRHLSWKMPVDNNADKVIHGTLIYGERQHHSKLTIENVMEILKSRGSASNAQLADRYNVSIGAIREVLSGRNWRRAINAALGRVEG